MAIEYSEDFSPLRYVIKEFDKQYAIVDQNTGQFLKGNRQPDGKGKRIWRKDLATATICCVELNKGARRALIDQGQGPDLPAREVNPFALAASKKGSATNVPHPHFVKCEKCQNMTKKGHTCE